MGNTEKDKKRPIELLKAANANKIKYVRFDLQLDGDNVIEAIMNAPDMFFTLEEQEKIYQKKYAECRAEGLAGLAINEADWKKEMEDTIRIQKETAQKQGKTFNEHEVRERALKDKPVDLAQQVAQKISKIRTVLEILPKVIKMSDGKTLMFPEAEDREEFKQIITSNMKLFTYLSEKYVDLFTQLTDEEGEVKNSSKQETLN